MKLPIEYICDIIALLSIPKEEYTIQRISKMEHCPPGVVRSLLDIIFYPPTEGFSLCIYENQKPQFWSDFRDSIEKDSERVKAFKSGKYDDLKISLPTKTGKLLLEEDTYSRWKETIKKITNKGDEKNELLYINDRPMQYDGISNSPLFPKVYSRLKDGKQLECEGVHGQRFFPFGIYFYPFTGEY